MDSLEEKPVEEQDLLTNEEELPKEEAPEDEAAPEQEASAEETSEPEEETSEEAQEEEEPDDGRQWYVVHSYSGYENKVKKNLEQRIATMGMEHKIFRVVVPTEEEVEIRDGQRRTSRRRVFPGYILVQMIMDDESWYVVRNTPGVTGFVGTGSKPVPLSQEEVDKILKRMEEEQPRIKVNFRVGERVRIVEGPFADFMGIVDELYPERGKVRVLVSFFGRETPVELDFLDVEKV
ncbi:MAG: transcription termination/antitermination protein NusG [Anaerolineae bacterium]|nr:transcription termination/antitermination protein NusG [Anaerolineae bacterium]